MRDVTIMEIKDISVKMTKHGDALVLYWTDGISEYQEKYPKMSVALARLALLAHCGEEDWWSFFNDTEIEFGQRWQDFVSQATTDMKESK